MLAPARHWEVSTDKQRERQSCLYYLWASVCYLILTNLFSCMIYQNHIYFRFFPLKEIYFQMAKKAFHKQKTRKLPPQGGRRQLHTPLPHSPGPIWQGTLKLQFLDTGDTAADGERFFLREDNKGPGQLECWCSCCHRCQTGNRRPRKATGVCELWQWGSPSPFFPCSRPLKQGDSTVRTAVAWAGKAQWAQPVAETLGHAAVIPSSSNKSDMQRPLGLPQHTLQSQQAPPRPHVCYQAVGILDVSYKH